MDHLDLFCAHKNDPSTPLEETLGGFETLVQQGKIHFAGASNDLTWRLADAAAIGNTRGWATVTCVEQRFTHLRPSPGGPFAPQCLIDDKILSFCDQRGKTMLPYTPLLRGAYVRSEGPLAASYRSGDSDVRLEVLHGVAGECGATASRVDHMRENLAAAELTLTPDQLNRLTLAGDVPNEEPN